MKYMGSKNRISKEILAIVLKNRKQNQWYVEPFVGGCNIIDKVKGKRLAGEINVYICAMWKELQLGWKPPLFISKDNYIDIKLNPSSYSKHLVGYVGINSSYSGKWFGGYAGRTKTKDGLRDYQKEAYNNVMKQIKNILGIKFICSSYDELNIPDNSIIYCDPPYENTTKYHSDFDSEKFWNWCRVMANKGHKVFISEYNAPKDFICVWEKKVSSSLSANGKVGKNKLSTEKLFTFVCQKQQVNKKD